MSRSIIFEKRYLATQKKNGIRLGPWYMLSSEFHFMLSSNLKKCFVPRELDAMTFKKPQ